MVLEAVGEENNLNVNDSLDFIAVQKVLSTIFNEEFTVIFPSDSFVYWTALLGIYLN